ncbi:MAG: diacylglycerol/lipid kinase family protein, partial [Bacteroidota bacterium]
MKSLIIILNGQPKKIERFRKQYQSLLENNFKLDVRETSSHGHAFELAKAAAAESSDGLLAAGGDGTLNQVLNGLMASGNASLPLGIIPLGTGNDFARFIGIRSPEDLLAAIKAGPQPTDVGRVSGIGVDGLPVTRHFINVSSLGMGPDVVRRLEKDTRSLGPSLTYLRATLRSFFNYRPELITATTPEGSWHGRIRALAVANGRSFGSGLVVAPHAAPDNGLLSTFTAGDVPLHEFLWFLGKIKAGKTIVHPKASYGTCTTLKLESPEGEVWT